MSKSSFSKGLKILLFTNGLVLIAAAMLGPIYALFVEEIGGDLLDASIAGGIFALTAGVVTLVSGHISDKIKKTEMMVILGYFLIGVGFLLYLFVDSILLLLIVQVIIGLGEAIYSPPFDKLYSKHLNHLRSGMEWGTWESMNYFTAAFGAFVGGFIVNHFGFDAIFVIMASLSFLSALYLLFLSPKKIL